MKRLTKPKSSNKKTINGTSSTKSPHELAAYSDKPHSDTLSRPANGYDPIAAPDDASALNEGKRSLAPTVATTPGTIDSDVGPIDVDRNSKSGTSHTLTGGMSSVSAGGGNSIFTSSNHSSHSLATTLTTIQSQAAPSHGQAPLANGHHGPHNSAFSPAYPPGAPASALPPYLTPHVPTTYRSATANNLLSDNASVLTLASSSHRPHRRNSLDTNASIRAIAPSSVWGGSRESLPLSVLSQSADISTTATGTPPSTAGIGPSGSRSASGLLASDRASGVGVPLLSSERNSLYTGKMGAKDGDSMKTSSIRSGVHGHGRNDSTAGSIAGFSSPLTVSKETDARDGH